MVRQAHRITEQLGLRRRAEACKFAYEADQVVTPAATSARSGNKERAAAASGKVVVRGELLPDGRSKLMYNF